LEPFAPIVGTLEKANAAATVVLEHDVVALEHHGFEERFQRQQSPAGRVLGRDDVEDIAVDEELRHRSGSKKVTHLLRPFGQWLAHWDSFCPETMRGGGSASRSSMAP